MVEFKSANFTVNVVDSVGSYGTYITDIGKITLAAAKAWQKFVVGSAPIEIVVSIEQLPENVIAQARSPTALIDTIGSTDLYQAAAAYELQTGIDPNGTVEDVYIELSTEFLGNVLWFDPTPSTDWDIPNNRLDALDVMMHELGHPLGFMGWRNASTGMLPGNYQSTFDQYVQFNDGLPYFIGPTAKLIYEAPVPLTPGNIRHYGYDPTGGEAFIPDGLMNGVVPYGTRDQISDLDLAILQDTGLDVFKTYYGSDGSDYHKAYVLSVQAYGGNGDDTLIGGLGKDLINGGAGDDVLKGKEGNDTLEGKNGADTIDGGLGTDIARGGAGDDTINGAPGSDKLFGQGGEDTINGGDDDDRIYGDTGDDVLFGNAGNDWFSGGSGADTVNGGTGDDEIFGGYSFDKLNGGRGNDTISGGNGNDVLLGEAGSDNLIGGTGNDDISGGADDDRLDGGGGNDSLTGDGGNDTIIGGFGFDTAIYGFDSANATITELGEGYFTVSAFGFVDDVYSVEQFQFTNETILI